MLLKRCWGIIAYYLYKLSFLLFSCGKLWGNTKSKENKTSQQSIKKKNRRRIRPITKRKLRQQSIRLTCKRHPAVRVTKDFYPFKLKDLPKFSHYVNATNIHQIYIHGTSTAFSSLYPLACGLLRNLKNFESIGNSCLKDKKVRCLETHVLVKFMELMKVWILESGQGCVNLGCLINILRFNQRTEFAEIVQNMIWEYGISLRSPKQNSVFNDEIHVYFLRNDNEMEEEEEQNPLIMSPQEAAFSNSIIIKEIFCNLERVQDFKNFRLVNRFCHEETISLLGKRARLWINAHISDKTYRKNHLTFGAYLNPPATSIANVSVAAHHQCNDFKCSTLADYHFMAYQISYLNKYEHREHSKPFTIGYEEDTFWKLCSSKIVDLKIHCANMDTGIYKFCEQLLLKGCKNLKSLAFVLCHEPKSLFRRTAISNDDDIQFSQLKDYFSNLYSLDFMWSQITPKNLQNILFLCPNLKVLSITNTNGEGLRALCYSTITGNLIALEKLEVLFDYYRQEFSPIEEYFKVLKQIGALKYFHYLYLNNVRLSNRGSFSFNLRAAIKHCHKFLRTLELHLEYNTTTRNNRNDRKNYIFTNLFWFPFNNLNSLTLFLKTICELDKDKDNDERSSNCIKNTLLFDFNAIKRMPVLEKLKIVIGIKCSTPYKSKHLGRRTEKPCDNNSTNNNKILQDCVFTRKWGGVKIYCPSLLVFELNGCSLNENDICLFSKCFPNLVHLNVDVKPSLLPTLVEKWNNLEILEIQTYRVLPLRYLIPMYLQCNSNKKKKKMSLKKVYQIVKETHDIGERVLEIQECNQILYFVK